jgi:hypothetical protein
MNRLRSLALVGLGTSVASLALAFLDAPSALSGWLAGMAFWSGVPIGALGLAMMMRVIPGPWRPELLPWAERLLFLLPLAALAVLPVLVGEGRLYAWASVPQAGFRGVYLSMWLFPLRTMLFFVVVVGLAIFLLVRPAIIVPLSAAGLVAFVLLDTTVIIDWLMSLDPAFHSSGFGLYGMSIQFTVAMAVILLLRLNAAEPGKHAGMMGGLLLVTLLVWTYLAFMQYVITWSDNLGHGVQWYERRGESGWAAVAYVIAATQLIPLFMLFFTPIRRGRAWLIGLCLVVLFGKALEMAWLVLPGIPNVGLGATSMALASIGLCACAVAVFSLPPLRRMAPS